MTLDNDSAAAAVGAYFGSNVFSDEPTWCSVVIDRATAVYDSVEEMRTALDLMNLRVEAHPTPA